MSPEDWIREIWTDSKMWEDLDFNWEEIAIADKVMDYLLERAMEN